MKCEYCGHEHTTDDPVIQDKGYPVCLYLDRCNQRMIENTKREALKNMEESNG